MFIIWHSTDYVKHIFLYNKLLKFYRINKFCRFCRNYSTPRSQTMYSRSRILVSQHHVSWKNLYKVTKWYKLFIENKIFLYFFFQVTPKVVTLWSIVLKWCGNVRPYRKMMMIYAKFVHKWSRMPEINWRATKLRWFFISILIYLIMKFLLNFLFIFTGRSQSCIRRIV